MKKETKNVLRIVISIVYILWGLWSPISAISAILSLDVGAILSAAVGVLTLLSGILGLVGVNRKLCRTFGVIIFVAAVVAVIVALPSINVNSIVTALLGWLFIVCI